MTPETQQIKQAFGSRLREARKASDWKLEPLAEALGMSKQGYLAWENGDAMPEAVKLPLVAATLGTTVGILFGEDIPQEQLDPVAALHKIRFYAGVAERRMEQIQVEKAQGIVRESGNVIPFPFIPRYGPSDFPFAAEPSGEEPAELSAAKKTRKPQNPKKPGRKPE